MADAPSQIALKNPSGDIVTVPAEQANDALAAGYSTTTPEEYQAAVFKAQHETTGQELGTLAEGVARGALPWAPAIEQGLGISDIPEQRARATVNPGLSTTGQLVGSGLQAAGVAGAVGALAPAAEAASDVAAGTDAATAAANAGATPAAVSAAASTDALQAPATLSKALGYAEQATAGGVQGATGSLNEQELGDHQFNGQALAADIGIGALLGVAGQAGINILGEKVLPAVISKADQALDAAGQKVKEAWFGATAGLSGTTPEKLEGAWQAIKGGAKPFSRDAADAFADGADAAKDQLKKLGPLLENEYRPAEVAKNIRDVPLETIRSGADGLNNALKQTLVEVQQTGEKLGFSSVHDAIDSARMKLEAALANPETTGEEFHAVTRKIGTQIGALQSDLKILPGITPPDSAALIGKLKSTYGMVKDNLKDASIWGGEQASRQAALDKSIRQVINTGNQVAKDFGIKEIDPDTGKMDWNFKASKIFNTFKERSDPLANQEKVEHLIDWIDSVKSHVAEIKTSAGTAGAVVPGGSEMSDLLDHLSAQRAAGQAYAPVAALLKQTREQPAWGLGAGGAAPLAGMVAHAAGVSIPGAAALAAPIAAIRSPVKAMQAFATITKTAAAARAAIGSTVRKVFASGPASAAVVGAITTPLRGRTFQSVTGQSAGADFQRQAKNVTALASDQGRQLDALAKNTSTISGVAPLTTQAAHQAAIKGLSVLAQAVPKNPAPSLIQSENKDWEPSQDQLNKWNDLHSAILKPQSYLDRLADGTATPQVWQALQAAYPEWTREVSSQAMQHLTTHPKLELNDNQKLTASMLIGGPVSPSVAPAQIAFQQAAFTPAPKPNQGKGARSRPTQHGLDKLSIGERLSTGPDRL